MNPGTGPDVVRHHAVDLQRLAAGHTRSARARLRIARPVGLALVKVGRRLAGADEHQTGTATRPVLRAVRG
jgi:hypothetical protein